MEVSSHGLLNTTRPAGPRCGGGVHGAPDHRRGGPACPGMHWHDGRRGELDIIARDDIDPACPWTVVIEVRTRVGRQRGSALASVDARKVARLRALTGAWCRQRGRLGSRVRIDVVALTLDAQALRHWPVVTCADVDLRSLGAQVVWLRGVQ